MYALMQPRLVELAYLKIDMVAIFAAANQSVADAR
jgi:hypothetical protein